MAQQKLYAGAKLREMRLRLSLTQKEFAAKLGVSLPYLNQMENNNRPVSTTVVLALAQEFGLDVTELSAGDSERLVSDMEATMRHLLNKLREAMIRGYATAKSPKERLYAVMDANFDDELFSVAQCSLWMQFWASAPYSPRLSRLHRINRSRVRSHFLAELNGLLPPDRVETARHALQCYMDGVWLQAAQSETPLDSAQARRAAHRVVDLALN